MTARLLLLLGIYIFVYWEFGTSHMFSIVFSSRACDLLSVSSEVGKYFVMSVMTKNQEGM